MSKPTRNTIAVFSDSREIADALNQLAEDMPRGDAYWLQEAACSILGLYKDAVQLQIENMRLRAQLAEASE